jgi:predicted nucleic acid binding AN1-type Zn finger protein
LILFRLAQIQKSITKTKNMATLKICTFAGCGPIPPGLEQKCDGCNRIFCLKHRLPEVHDRDGCALKQRVWANMEAHQDARILQRERFEAGRADLKAKLDAKRAELAQQRAKKK